jgi:hypothetical protein
VNTVLPAASCAALPDDGVVAGVVVVAVGLRLTTVTVPASGVFWPRCWSLVRAWSCNWAAASAAAMLCVWRSSQRRHCGNDMTLTSATMSAWLRPHSSAHWPWNTCPLYFSGIWNHVWFV